MTVNYTKTLLNKILLKKAKGYTYREKTEEYAVVDGEKQLVKSKTVTKHVQPDIGAVKVLLALDDGGTDVTKMTDGELQAEKLRLIRLLDEVNESPPASETNRD